MAPSNSAAIAIESSEDRSSSGAVFGIEPGNLHGQMTPTSSAAVGLVRAAITTHLNVLVASTDPVHEANALAFTKYLYKRQQDGTDNVKIALKAITDASGQVRCLATGPYGAPVNDILPQSKILDRPNSNQEDVLASQLQARAIQLVEWADILIVVSMDADTIARMINGLTGSLILEIIRSWNATKSIFLVPKMSTYMWRNPATARQMRKLRRKWTWVRVFDPILWHIDDSSGESRLVQEGHTLGMLFGKLGAALQELAERQTTLRETKSPSSIVSRQIKSSPRIRLPPEIWGVIMGHLGDWEIAMALNVFANLPPPPEWSKLGVHKNLPPPPERLQCQDNAQRSMRELEWTILTGSYQDVKKKLATIPRPERLSHLCVKLVVKFSSTKLLSLLETSYHDLFVSSFGHGTLPTLASAAFGQTAVLDWWRNSPSFFITDYDDEALDGASKAGFVHVLEWWRKSGLPLRYSEASLEQASAKGNIEVLDWWRDVSLSQAADRSPQTTTTAATVTTSPPLDSSKTGTLSVLDRGTPPRATGPPRLKVGRSICFAAQHGQTAAIQWWSSSGIPYGHADSVAKLASTHGHVPVLQLWAELKRVAACEPDKTMFSSSAFAVENDTQVLVGPTKNGRRDVLEWWKQSGFRIEYRTWEIEEALEDCTVGGEGEREVREWWARNGLNLGVGTSEWMKVKVLGDP